MCRLLGYIARRPINPGFAFFTGDTNLFTLSHEHSDGWGIAWTSNLGWEVFKEPVALYLSESAERVVQEIRSLLVIAHIRKASQGEKSHVNTHPFTSGNWAFAHNGTIGDYSRLREMLGERTKLLQGETDSEAFFQLLIKNIEDRGDIVEGVRATIKQLEDNGIHYTSLNSVFSDGSQLYGLNLFRGSDSEYYTMYMGRFMIDGVELVAIASEPVGGIEGWEKIGNNKLVVVDRHLTPSIYTVI